MSLDHPIRERLSRLACRILDVAFKAVENCALSPSSTIKGLIVIGAALLPGKAALISAIGGGLVLIFNTADTPDRPNRC